MLINLPSTYQRPTNAHCNTKGYREPIRNFLCPQGVSSLFPTKHTANHSWDNYNPPAIFYSLCELPYKGNLSGKIMRSFFQSPFHFLASTDSGFNLWLWLVLALVLVLLSWFSSHWIQDSDSRILPPPSLPSSLSNPKWKLQTRTPLWLQHRELGMLRRPGRLGWHWQFPAPDVLLPPSPTPTRDTEIFIWKIRGPFFPKMTPF